MSYKRESLNDYFLKVAEDYKKNGEIAFYIDPVKMDKVLCCELSLDIDDLLYQLRNFSVTIDQSDIEKYLTKKFMDDKILQAKISSLPEEKSSGIINSETATLEFEINLQKSRYEFNPEYFHKLLHYVAIVEERELTLCKILDSLINHHPSEVADYITDLDLRMSDNLIHYEDAIRLLEAVIYNYKDLVATYDAINNVDTYLDYLSKTAHLNIYSITNAETPASPDLQIKDLLLDGSKGYVRLSEKQRLTLKEKQDKTFNGIYNLIKDLV